MRSARGIVAGMRRFVVVLVVGIVGVAVYFAYPYVVVGYLKRGIEAATTAEAETAALCRANHWVHSGFAPTYQVGARDAGGAELRPWQDGGYDRVAAVTLTWSTGQAVDRTLLTREGLGCVFGE